MNQWKNAKVNFLGDSITEGHGTSGADGIYMKAVSDTLGFACTRNYGIGGTRIAAQPDDGGSAFSVRYLEMEKDADLILVFGGTNDYGHGTAQIGSFHDRGTETFYGACHTLMEGLMNLYTDKTIVFMTPLHRENEQSPNPATGYTLAQYVEVLKEMAEYYAIPVLDLWANSGIQPCIASNKEKYCPDGLHPNDAGQQLIARRLSGFLKTI